MNTNAVEVAKRCKERLGQYELSMAEYMSVCGTSFCMLGDLAHQDGYPDTGYLLSRPNLPGRRPTVYLYKKYSEQSLGIAPTSLEWVWLFDPDWGNNLDVAYARCNYVIKHGNAPPEGDPRWTLLFDSIRAKSPSCISVPHGE